MCVILILLIYVQLHITTILRSDSLRKFGNYLIIILFLVFIFAIGVQVALTPDKASLFYENRALAQKPVITKEAIMDGSFTKGYESYFTDQITGRDSWVKGYLKYQQLTNQTFNFNYYINEEDQWIYPKPVNYTAFSNIDQSHHFLKELGNYTNEHDMELFFFLLPERMIMLDTPFPPYVKEGYEKVNKKYFVENMPQNHLQFINMEESFRKQFNQEQLKTFYYQTDHHWNSAGAFEGYRVIYNALNDNSSYFNEPIFNEKNFENTCFPDESFLGSYNKQLYEVVHSEDLACTITPTNFDYNKLEVYLGPIEQQFKVPYNDFYGKDINKGLDLIEYGGVFTGDFREVNIINPRKKASDSKVLFIKDSYANPLTLLLAQHFYQSTFYDMRYNPDRTLFELIESNDFDLIVFLYNDLTIFPNMYDFHLELS